MSNFDKKWEIRCGIVTCGGLCPGLNDVIRTIVLALHYHYDVRTIFGFPYGYEGLCHKYGHAPIELTPAVVEDIHQIGGTILGSSCGRQDVSEMVDCLERMNSGLLFTIGGDGTLRGARAFAEEIGNRNLRSTLAVSPKPQTKNIIFLTADAFGVLPPIARLTPEQAKYHYISGYTAKVAGTERGITEPQATFSACFGAPFMAQHPSVYAALLGKKIAEHNATSWLVNTGRTGGPYGVGNRMKIAYTRAMVSAAYDAQAKKPAAMFVDNFKQFEDQVSSAIKATAPKVH